MLTDRTIQRLKPGMHADADGLYLRVSPKGKRTWVVRSQKAGKDTWRAVGHYPNTSLAAARQILIHGAHRTLSTAEAVDEFMRTVKVRRPEKIRYLLDQLPDDSLTAGKKTLVEHLRIRAKTAPVMANRLLAYWKQFFSFTVQMAWREANPLDGVERRFVGGRETPKERVLSWDEIEMLINNPPIENYEAILFVLLTGLRPSEAVWVLQTQQTVGIPTKTTRHTLPESRLIRWAVRNIQFRPASHSTMSGALWRAKAGYTPHDLRRTFVTRLADLGVAPHVVEKLVNHKMPGMMAVYNHADYWPERNAAQRLWDKKLLSLRRKP
jgi:integrase